jgi:hypothetical protein
MDHVMPLWRNEERFETPGLQGAEMSHPRKMINEHSLPNVWQDSFADAEPAAATVVIIRIACYLLAHLYRT